MADVHAVIDVLINELEVDAKLPANDRNKMSREERTNLLDKIFKLQLSKGKHKRDVDANGVSRTGKKMGRPRRDLNPVNPSAVNFLKQIKEVARDERQEREEPEEGKSEASVT